MYTYGNGCNGWQVANLEECQAKCTRNEFPSPTCDKDQTCMYVVYTEGTIPWCHLADHTCGEVDANNIQMLYIKGKGELVQHANAPVKLFFPHLPWAPPGTSIFRGCPGLFTTIFLPCPPYLITLIHSFSSA